MNFSKKSLNKNYGRHRKIGQLAQPLKPARRRVGLA